MISDASVCWKKGGVGCSYSTYVNKDLQIVIILISNFLLQEKYIERVENKEIIK